MRLFAQLLKRWEMNHMVPEFKNGVEVLEPVLTGPMNRPMFVWIVSAPRESLAPLMSIRGTTMKAIDLACESFSWRWKYQAPGVVISGGRWKVQITLSK
jgi:hypothetical protein